MAIFVSCSNTNKLPAIGEKVDLTKECLSAISESYYDKLNEVCNNKDEDALTSMISAQTVYVLNPYINSYTVRNFFRHSLKIVVRTIPFYSILV